MRNPSLALALVFVLACTACSADNDIKPTDRVRKFLTPQAMDILAGGTKVETFRVNYKEHSDKEEDEKKLDQWIGGYKITASGKDQGKEFAADLRAVLFSEKTYLFNIAKACIFQPGVGFRVWKDKEFVEVLLCFSCDEVLVRTRLDGGKWSKAHEDFDPARPALVKLAKTAFPDDKVIQGLTDKRKD